MPLTDHQAKYLAHELTHRWSSDSVGKLAAAVAGALRIENLLQAPPSEGQQELFGGPD